MRCAAMMRVSLVNLFDLFARGWRPPQSRGRLHLLWLETQIFAIGYPIAQKCDHNSIHKIPALGGPYTT